MVWWRPQEANREGTYKNEYCGFIFSKIIQILRRFGITGFDERQVLRALAENTPEGLEIVERVVEPPLNVQPVNVAQPDNEVLPSPPAPPPAPEVLL